MTKNLDLDGLHSIADNYDLFYIDLWGVIHNGISLHKEAVQALYKLEEKGKDFVLLTNAPRPNDTVNKFLNKMGMKEGLRDHVFTSGEAALNFLKKSFKSKNFYHIGPPRDFDLFNEFRNNKSTELKESEYLLCTGLFEENENDLNYTLSLIKKYDIINSCYQKAKHYINLSSNSLSVFKDSEEKNILENLTSFSLSRNF